MRENHYVMLRRDNGFWYYYVYRYGKRVYRSTGEKRKADAIDVIHDRLLSDDLLNEQKPAKPLTFAEFAEPFWNYETCPIIRDKVERGGHYSKAFARTRRYQMEKYLIPEFGKKCLLEFNTQMLKVYLRSLPARAGLLPQTANKVFCILRQMLDVAVEEKLIPDNPARNVAPLVEKAEARGCFTKTQINTLFNSEWDDPYIELACKLSATTGMRMGEVRALSRDQIKDDYILVDRAWAESEGLKTTKSGSARTVPVLENIRKELLSLPQKGDLLFSYNGKVPITGKVILARFKAQMDKCGINYEKENLSFHSFRHFFNTRLIADGIGSEQVRAVIGHESEEMTEHYLHLSSSDLTAIRKVQKTILFSA